MCSTIRDKKNSSKREKSNKSLLMKRLLDHNSSLNLNLKQEKALKQASLAKQVFAGAITVALSLALLSDLSRFTQLRFSSDEASSGQVGQSRPSSKLTAWASWIGEVPTAAELYGDAASEMPTTEAFDDDEEDEELDASASNEYPDNENEADESYEDPDEAEQESEQESRRSEHWLASPSFSTNNKEETTNVPALESAKSGHKVWADLEGWRRNKREIEDRISLASRRQANRRRQRAAAENNKADADEFGDDGDEDAWVHDGIDDIQIDPETKKAASELSYDENKSIDAEYEPQQKQESNVVNRTRITTIAEVIPMNVPESDFGDGPDGDSARASGSGQMDTRINSRFLLPPANSQLLPAAHLSIEEAQRLVAQQAEPHFYSTSASTRANTLVSPPVEMTTSEDRSNMRPVENKQTEKEDF